jgi:hypothetical protein
MPSLIPNGTTRLLAHTPSSIPNSITRLPPSKIKLGAARGPLVSPQLSDGQRRKKKGESTHTSYIIGIIEERKNFNPGPEKEPDGPVSNTNSTMRT